jgi:signal transduction histidine kinase
MADWYSVDVLEGGELRCIAVEHSDPAKTALAYELHARSRCRLDDQRGIGAVVRTGRTELIEDIDDATIMADVGGDGERLAMVRALAPRSIIMVPLKAREQTFGAMKLGSSVPGRHYGGPCQAVVEELGRRVGIAIDNARAYREAREAVRLRDEFLTIAGHELRTPLTALKLQLQSVAHALGRGAPPSPADLSSRLDKTLGLANRLQQLIDHLLDVSHVTSQPLVLDRRETDLAALWRAVIARHEPEAVRCGSVVSFTSSGETVGRFDPVRIDQVLTSLLANALKYGKGRPVRVTLHGEAGSVRTLVQDEGIGIDLSAQSRMFGRFERAVSVRNYGGFGLGLWIVRELVEAHGGTVGFESRPGQGSTFWVDLPRAAGPA